jgi:hypothetical protein
MFYQYGLSNLFINKIKEYFFRGTGIRNPDTIITDPGTIITHSVTATVGLWGACTKSMYSNNQTICGEFGLVAFNWQNYAKLLGSRVFVTIACIFSSFSILSVSLILLVNADSKRIAALFTIVFSIGSLIAGIIGFALGITFVLQSNEFDLSLKIGASSIIAIIALVFNILGTIASFIIK